MDSMGFFKAATANKKVIFSSCSLAVAAALFSLHFGQETPILFKGNKNLCPKLREVPFAEKLGLVKKVTKLNIEGIKAPYNPGLVETSEGFFLVFRHDLKERKRFLGIKTPFRQKIHLGNLKMPFRTFISSLHLDKSFRPVTLPKRVQTGSDFSEDPRLFTFQGDTYLSYNDIQTADVECRTIRIAKLNTDTGETKEPVDFTLNLQRVEKNWAPFIYSDQGKNTIHFEYCFNPHVVMKMEDPLSSDLVHLKVPNHIALQNIPWHKSWGIVRGGTPPILVDGQYLAFFHSFFRQKGKIWYVMGAYTFEAEPPFRVTACSKLPILFKGIYGTKTNNTAYSRKPSIFPSGLTYSHDGEDEVIHVACGENDCGVKIVTFYKEALLKSLTPIPLFSKIQ